MSGCRGGCHGPLKSHDEIPAISEVDIVGAAREARERDTVVLTLERPRTMNDEIRRERFQIRGETATANIKRRSLQRR